MANELQNIISLLRKTFEGGAWHGPSVKEVLDKVSEDQAHSRLPDTHSIIELVAHMTSWRIYVSRKLKGDAEFKVSDELNFPKVENWNETVTALEESQRQLIADLEQFASGRLTDQVPGSSQPLSFYTLLHAIIHHDLYHAGQIMLIQKATSKQSF